MQRPVKAEHCQSTIKQMYMKVKQSLVKTKHYQLTM
jgi:hypothetical protein